MSNDELVGPRRIDVLCGPCSDEQPEPPRCIIGAVVEDPWGAAKALWDDFIAADHWDEYAGEGTGRVTVNVAMLLLGGAGVLKTLKGLKGLQSAEVAGAILRNGEQFHPNGTLKPNVTYKTGEFEYIYTTDKSGHISSFHADELNLKTHEGRLPHNPNTPGKQPDDHAGHLAGDRFGGSPELDNLVSQLSRLNLSSYRKLENRWATALDLAQPGGPRPVSVEVNIHTDPATGRPTQVDVKYSIDGKRFCQ